MRFSHIMPAAFLAAAICPTSAFAADPETVAVPTEMDYSEAGQAVDPIISSLKASKFQDAVNLAFEANPLFSNMGSQIPVLVGQITTTGSVNLPNAAILVLI